MKPKGHAPEHSTERGIYPQGSTAKLKKPSTQGSGLKQKPKRKGH